MMLLTGKAGSIKRAFTLVPDIGPGNYSRRCGWWVVGDGRLWKPMRIRVFLLLVPKTKYLVRFQPCPEPNQTS